VADSVEKIVDDLVAQLRSGPQDTGWSSSYDDGTSLISDVERLGTLAAGGDREAVRQLRLLFAPTGALQETALASGWSEEYMLLARRLDTVT
jgi:hypothetical protein